MQHNQPPNARSHIAFLSIGANIGDKKNHCLQGIRMLCQADAIRLMTHAPFYQTEPVDYEDQDWFVNTAIKIETTLDPYELLKKLKCIEQQVGRQPSVVRFGPRILDMDIILFDQIVLNSAQLQIPHPRMHKRRFVLQPICDIEPEVLHPVREKTVCELLSELNPENQKIKPLT
jgi:2-amino-4-hydroxy-6-hydroxymethyldihydropteridine diphosphokinase